MKRISKSSASLHSEVSSYQCLVLGMKCTVSSTVPFHKQLTQNNLLIHSFRHQGPIQSPIQIYSLNDRVKSCIIYYSKLLNYILRSACCTSLSVFFL